MEAVKIGNRVFNSLKEYEEAYIKEWERIHPYLAPDMNWVRSDWKYRLEQKP